MERGPDAADEFQGVRVAADRAFRFKLAELLGPRFVGTFLAYKRNELERFGRWVTDWEFREYSYHL